MGNLTGKEWRMSKAVAMLCDMAKSNFSHYGRVTPVVVARCVKRGAKPTDDMLTEAIGRIDPPLLHSHAMRSLLLEVDPKAERRGRRPKPHLSRRELAAALKSVSRPDVPQSFLESLIERLKKGKQSTEQHRSMHAHRHLERIKSGMLAESVYSEMRELIDPQAKSVTHPTLGTHTIDEVDAPLRDKALAVTNRILNASGDIRPISNDRLKNFISDYRTGKLAQIS